jgi:hypothetical protein
VDVVVHACNPSYTGVRGLQSEAGLGKSLRPSLKNKGKRIGAVAQVVKLSVGPEFK